MSDLLDADALVAQACATTGLDDFGADGWREGLDRLLASLRSEAALNELGEQIVAGEIGTYLATRLGVVAAHAANPAIAAVDVTPPIVIVGQARTGTTILHDLLALDPEHRVPLTWEVDRPIPAPRTETYETDPRIDEVQATLDGVDLVLPGFRAMHPMGARLPQECVRITAIDFKSMIFPTQYRVPSYARWLIDEADMTSAYRFHRLFLQHLQSEHPAPRWVLKSPGHIWCLDALLREYPNALFVQTHRDPLRIIASVSSLIGTLRSLASDDTSIPDAANEFAEYIVEGCDRSVVARGDGTVAAGRAVDVQFRNFVNDPIATVREIYERLGLTLGDEAEHRMRAHLDAHPGEKHAYSWNATGLDESYWRSRTARYQDFFGVPSEPAT